MSIAVVSFAAFFVAVVALLRAWGDHVRACRRILDLQRETQEVRKLLQRRGFLAHEVAHEIKNPLTAILCSAEALDLLIGKSLPEEHQLSLRYIRDYGDNLLRLVSDFLDVSRAESGAIEARPESTALAPAIESVVGLLRSNSMKRHLSITWNVSEPALHAYVDPRHFKQILFNLLHNAIKFTPQGGSIEVSARPEYMADRVAVSVRDCGIGIPAAFLPLVWDPYAHLESNDDVAAVGVGLGLALCKTLTELAGGTISVESVEGRGSTFTVMLPLPVGVSQPVRPDSRAYLKDGVSPLQGQRFLVVDDDSGVRDSLAALIEAWGGMVDKVSQAVDAVEAVGRREYSAVMLDQSGNEAESTIAAISRHIAGDKKPKVILATRDEIDAGQAERVGADLCISKPINGKRLLESLTVPRQRS